MKRIPDMSSYVSQRVFEGVRVLTGKEAEETRARVKRAFDKLKKKED